jgi:DNA invertase Pin-like site-specific DNA recombinase
MLSAYRQKKQASALPPPPDDASDVLALPYLRVSSKRQDRGLSPQAQRAETADYIARHGWTPGTRYRDTLQGWRTDRPGYQKLLAEVRRLRAAGRAVVVVSVHIDRSGRLGEEMLRADTEFRSLGVEWHFTRQNGTLDRLRTFMEGLGAEMETAKLKQRVAASKVVAASLDLPASGPAGWGYRWRYPETDEEKRTFSVGRSARQVLDLDEAQAPSVRDLFTRFAEGESLGSLCRWAAALPVAARGLVPIRARQPEDAPVDEHAGLDGEGDEEEAALPMQPRTLTRHRLQRILRSTLYVARYTTECGYGYAGDPAAYLEQTKKGHWPALVEDDVWLAVQLRLAAAAAAAPPRGRPSGRPGTPSARWLLSGRVRCPKCDNSTMYAEARPRGDRVLVRYHCASRIFGAGKADHSCGANVSLPALDAAVKAELGIVLGYLSTTDAEGVWPALLSAWEVMQPVQTTPEAEVTRTALTALVEERTKQLAALDALAGVLDAATLTTNRAKLAQERDEAAVALAALPPRVTPAMLPPLPDIVNDADAWLLAFRAGDVATIAPIVRELIAEVRPVQLGKGHGAPALVGADLRWTERGRVLFDLAAAVRLAVPEADYGEWTPTEWAGTAEGKLVYRGDVYNAINLNRGPALAEQPPAQVSEKLAQAVLGVVAQP